MSDIGTLDCASVTASWITVGRDHYNGLLALVDELRRQLTLAQAADEDRRQQMDAMFAECERLRAGVQK